MKLVQMFVHFLVRSSVSKDVTMASVVCVVQCYFQERILSCLVMLNCNQSKIIYARLVTFIRESSKWSHT